MNNFLISENTIVGSHCRLLLTLLDKGCYHQRLMKLRGYLPPRRETLILSMLRRKNFT